MLWGGDLARTEGKQQAALSIEIKDKNESAAGATASTKESTERDKATAKKNVLEEISEPGPDVPAKDPTDTSKTLREWSLKGRLR
ncbi:hypothetical protein MRX96_038311 [Rhipicephalus microplus]